MIIVIIISTLCKDDHYSLLFLGQDIKLFVLLFLCHVMMLVIVITVRVCVCQSMDIFMCKLVKVSTSLLPKLLTCHQKRSQSGCLVFSGIKQVN